MKTVISLTPLSLDRDSRTFKIAASLARLGFRSVVVENRPSATLPAAEAAIDVITLGRWRQADRTHRAAPSKAEDTATRWRRRLAPLAPSWLRERVHLIVFALVYFIWRPALALFQIPKADLYYLHEYRMFPTVWLLRLIRGKVPVIYDAHDIYQDVAAPEILSRFWRRIFLPFLGWMELWTSANACAVVTVGEGVAERISAILSRPCTVIRNCHDSRLERPAPQSLRQSVQVGPGQFLVAVIGNRKPGQDITPLLAALAELPSAIHVAFIGRFYDEAQSIASHYGVAERVHWLGAASIDSLVPFAREADAAALLYWPNNANTMNALPNGLFQSLSAGLPLLYPALPEIVRVIGDQEVGRIIDPCDRQSIFSALTWLWHHRDYLPRLRNNCTALAAEFSWQNEEMRLKCLVEKILGPGENPL